MLTTFCLRTISYSLHILETYNLKITHRTHETVPLFLLHSFLECKDWDYLQAILEIVQHIWNSGWQILIPSCALVVIHSYLDIWLFIFSNSQPETWGLVSERSWHICAIAWTKTPPTLLNIHKNQWASRYMQVPLFLLRPQYLHWGSIVETILAIEDPEPIKTARFDLIVKAVPPQFCHWVISTELVSALSCVVVANNSLAIWKQDFILTKTFRPCFSIIVYMFCAAVS